MWVCIFENLYQQMSFLKYFRKIPFLFFPAVGSPTDAQIQYVSIEYSISFYAYF